MDRRHLTRKGALLTAAASLALLLGATGAISEGATVEPPPPAAQEPMEKVPAPAEQVPMEKPPAAAEQVPMEQVPPPASPAAGQQQAPGTPPMAGTAQAPAPSADVAGGVTCEPEKVCMVDATGLPLRVLARSVTALYASPDDAAAPVTDAVGAFKPAFVFARKDLDNSDKTNPKGWYQVGYGTEKPIGWMRAKDVFEWRQALTLAYRFPGVGAQRRSPVLLFETLDPLKSMASAGSAGKAQVDAILGQIKSGQRPANIIGKESDQFLNIDEDFYFLPVLQWERETKFEEASHYLQVFAAVPGERAKSAGEGSLVDPETLAQIDKPADVSELTVDVKFVIDMTGSMQPYIDGVRSAIVKLVQDLPGTVGPNATLRFGLIGYRDDPKTIPLLEWSVKNFTPELVDANALIALLENNKKPLAAQVSSDEWAEDVFAGYKQALDSSWSSDKSLHLVILIGDASGHPPSTPTRQTKNSIGMDAEEVRVLADQKGIYATAIYLKDNDASGDWSRGIEQFSILGRNKKEVGGAFQVATEGIKANTSSNELTEILSIWSKDVAGVISEARAGDAKKIEEMAGGGAPPRLDSPAPATKESEVGLETMRGVFRAALVDYLGDTQKAPRDYMAWVFDRDLSDATRQSLDIRVMVTRQELDNIVRQTQALQEAMTNAIMGRIDFFQALKLVAAKTSLGVEVKEGVTLGEQEYLPKWVAALPYQSRVLGMSTTGFENMTPTEQMVFEATLRSKLEAYKDIYNSPDQWHKLDPNDPELLDVYALPLTLLP